MPAVFEPGEVLRRAAGGVGGAVEDFFREIGKVQKIRFDLRFLIILLQHAGEAQGIGAGFISKISGSYTNVVGLPLAEVRRDLERLLQWIK